MADRLAPLTNSAPAGPSPTLATLVGGIVSDLQTLVRQELQLARREVQQELDKAKFGVALLGGGLALLVMAVVSLLFMLDYLLKEYTTIPLWGCFGIVGGGFLLLGGLLIAAGVAKFRRAHLVPPLTAQTLRENVQWIQNRT
jgi:hypothetical protein